MYSIDRLPATRREMVQSEKTPDPFLFSKAHVGDLFCRRISICCGFQGMLAPGMPVTRLITIALLFVLVQTGCSFKYQPVGFRGGYSETSLNEDTITVRYKAPSNLYTHPVQFTKEQHIQFFLLYRCAEVTSTRGYDYFEIVESTVPIVVARSIKTSREYRVIPIASAGSMVGAVGRRLPRSTGDSANTIDTDTQEATIRMLVGEKPDSKLPMYDARELLKTLPLKNPGLSAALKDRES
jgi:hypothetical protein